MIKIISNFQIKKVKEKYNISGDYILFLSTLKPSKNIEGLLEAFKILGISPPAGGLELVIAGKKGWMYEAIFEKVKKLNLEQKVIFTDFVAEDEVPGLMAGAKVFVMPSFWEGFGIPILEAMATGVPTVVSNVGSLPEVVGEAGIVVDPYSPEDIARGIKEALDKKDLLVKKGLEQVKKFSWVKCARNTLEVLEKYGRFS
jgi:glycosyltransferase involved in cell wall biosynthesis